MPIDIDQLTESELIDLNHRIVARLRFLRHLESHASMLEFRIGERVTFNPEGRPPVTGMITRYNKKTSASSQMMANAGTWHHSFSRRRRREEALWEATKAMSSLLLGAINIPNKSGRRLRDSVQRPARRGKGTRRRTSRVNARRPSALRVE